jgi:hypothetical protein
MTETRQGNADNRCLTFSWGTMEDDDTYGN